ncbi:MAG: PQQ-dependent sugar dehydrogenase [Anaerolineales bacterium]|nr:PQQ-dependent sugar dehydrogenase [Anaerolineales bacterium]MCB9128169.1 PQQ-dependent sugar dehydrogenase [Ardenticatenales bacterium]MCB9171878.1 PQQ-dependent sugar dehydrogenase [Ardenticatenales bacterium]
MSHAPSIELTPGKIARRLTLVALALIALSTLFHFTALSAGEEAFWGQVNWLDDRFFVDKERNFPTFFTVLLMLFSALLLEITARLSKREQEPHGKKWRVLSLGFLFMAFDEGFVIHEMAIEPLQRLLGGGDLGALHFAWVGPGIVLVLLLSFYFLPFLSSLKAQGRIRFILAASLYLGGALGMEMFNGQFAERVDFDYAIYSIWVTVEEGLEISGLVVFVWALLVHLRAQYGMVSLNFGRTAPMGGDAPTPLSTGSTVTIAPSWKQHLATLATLLAAVVVLIFIFRSQLFRPIERVAAPEKPGNTALQSALGTSVWYYAEALDEPRHMAVGAGGYIFVAERGANRLLALVDNNGDGSLETSHVVLDELDRPDALAFDPNGEFLYIGEQSQISRVKVAGIVKIGEPEVVIVEALPDTIGEIAFGADGLLYVARRSRCNLCMEAEAQLASIWRYQPDGSGGELVMGGLRRVAGLALQPDRGILWASNSEADLSRRNLPPDTLFRVTAGGDAGWPRCHAGIIIDSDLGDMTSCDNVEQPAITLAAHSAPQGLTFYDQTLLGAEFSGDLFVALGGSSEQNPPTGDKVVRIVMEDGLPTGVIEDFVYGWRTPEGTRIGRPVDIVTTADGALLISDDQAGAIYRVVPSPTETP